MNLDRIELFLQENIFPDLEKGRPEWDVPHTISVVKNMKWIITEYPELLKFQYILIIAAYAHDWGYMGLFADNNYNFAEVIQHKKEHARIGAEKIAKLLEDDIFNTLTEDDKARIVHLVFKHDRLKELKDVDELTLMEADTLGALDINQKVTFKSSEDRSKYKQGVIHYRLPLFIHDKAIKKAKQFLF